IRACRDWCCAHSRAPESSPTARILSVRITMADRFCDSCAFLWPTLPAEHACFVRAASITCLRMENAPPFSSRTEGPGQAVSDSSPPAIPDHDLLHVIGRGAYGEVWLARHTRLGTLRAI